MIVELDAGNSRVKWRQLDDQHTATLHQGFVSELAELEPVLAELQAPQMVRMCSVREAAVEAAVERIIHRLWGLPVHIARVVPSCAGFRNQYSDQSRLGVDRWLAMLAASNAVAGAKIIIDSGTAMTIDVVDARGLHQGGYITPGLGLMRASLVNNTRIRLASAPVTPSLALGHSTDDAVNNGTLAAQIALIDRVVASSRQNTPDTTVYYTGGDAELLASLASHPDFEIVPNLVLDGLAYACPWPEGN